MSSTNQTATIGLSQYIGTDKPTYLSDYNGDMLKIDNAIAADRDSIATAQNKADGADGKADANAQSIATINDAINNTTNGLAKRVTDVEGDVNTIESLIGNGTPTTTDHTIIGGINELHSDITGLLFAKDFEGQKAMTADLGDGATVDVTINGYNAILIGNVGTSGYTANVASIQFTSATEVGLYIIDSVSETITYHFRVLYVKQVS